MNWGLHIASNGFLIGVLLLNLASCKKEGAGCIDGRGAQTTKLVDLQAFDKIVLSDRIDITFIQDSSNFALIEYGENVIGGVELGVTNGTLHIQELNRCGWVRKVDPVPHIELHYRDFSEILSHSSGDIVFENAYTGDSLFIQIEDVSGDMDLFVDCTYLNLVQHTGATDISVKGSVAEVYIYNSGYAPIRAEELVARIASVHSNSVGDTYVRAWETLYYQIFHHGDIYLFGIANIVEWHKEGPGQVFRAGD